jgi:hypothetical protein
MASYLGSVRRGPPPLQERDGASGAMANTNKRDHVGGGSEQNKRPLMRKWEVVAPS